MTTLNREYILTRFEKGFKTYDKHARVQNWMAEQLCHFIGKAAHKKQFDRVFEIGAGTGLFTRKFMSRYTVSQLWVNDLSDKSFDYLKDLGTGIIFLGGPVEEIDFPSHLDLVMANAVFQWIEDHQLVLEKIYHSLRPGGILAFSTFGPKNLVELADLTGNGLKYPDLTDWKRKLTTMFSLVRVEEYIQQYTFANPYEVLKHLKYTGTNAIKPAKWTRSSLQQFEAEYRRKFSLQEGVRLTYAPIFITGRKK